MLELQPQFMLKDQNEALIRNYARAMNERDWDAVASMLHEDYSGRVGRSKQKAEFNVNPLIEFLKLLYVDPEIIKALTDLEPNQNKVTQIDERKLVARFLQDWQITDIIADDDRVWVSRIATILDPKQLEIPLSSTMKFWIKDGKIIRSSISGRYLNSLIQFGKIVVERDVKDELKHYLEGLRRLGVLPVDPK